MLLEFGIASEAKNTEMKPNHIMIEPHNKYTRLHNSVTTSRHDKSTKKNVTTSIHHDKTTPHNEVIKQRYDQNSSRQACTTRQNGEPHNVLK